MQLFEAAIVLIPDTPDCLTCQLRDFIEAIALKEIKLKGTGLIYREFIAKAV